LVLLDGAFRFPPFLAAKPRVATGKIRSKVSSRRIIDERMNRVEMLRQC
jgi:hypothetical protein